MPANETLGRSRARIAASRIAREMIAVARSSAEPVVFVTGAAPIPTLRSYERAEGVWQHGTAEDWEELVDTLERCLSNASVLLDAPEYDNALYVVDLARFEYDEDADGDSLQDGWRPINADDR